MNRQLLLFVFSVLLLACKEGGQKDAPAQAPSLPPLYYYYPRANVYFDSANKDYLFMATEGGAWQSAKQIPAVVQGLMDKSVLVPNPPQPVWKDNENHKLLYSALLYATPNDTVVKKQIPKPVAKQKIPEEKEKKKDRKGLRRFIDKIFSGIKKDKQEKDSGKQTQ